VIEIARPSQPLVKVEITLSAGGHIHCQVSGAAGDRFWLMGFLQQAILGLATQSNQSMVQPPPAGLPGDGLRR
jgi:hypothetical protein